MATRPVIGGKAGCTRSAVRSKLQPAAHAVATNASACIEFEVLPGEDDAFEDDAFEDDAFEEITGASDADCEESNLEDLEPIEPEEVLDLVDAQSASESADASEDSDAEPEASSSPPSRHGRTLIPVVNKAKPLVTDTRHAASKEPSALYPLRPTTWRPLVNIAQINAAAAIASANSVQNPAHSSGIHRFPPPVFAKAPPLAVSKPPAPAASATPVPCSAPSKAEKIEFHATGDIPPPCELEGDDCWDWSALSNSFCPTSTAPSTFQPPSRPPSKPIHIPPHRTLAIARLAAGPGSTLPIRPATACAAITAPANTPQWVSASAAAAAVPTLAHAPHVPAPVARNTTPGTFAPQQGNHQRAVTQPKQPESSLAAAAARNSPLSLYEQQQEAVLGTPRSRGPQRSHFVGLHYSPFGASDDDVHLSLIDTSPSPVAVQPAAGVPPMPTCCPSASALQDQPPVQQQPKSHSGQQSAVRFVPQTATCNAPSQPTSSARIAEEAAVADAADPLNDLLGEIDQFILNQNDVCMLPEDTLATGLLPISGAHQPSTAHVSQGDSAGPAGTSSAPTNSAHRLQQPPAGLSLTLNTASNSNGDIEQDFMPMEADFQPLTPRTPHSSTDVETPPELSPTDWEAVFPGISPIAGDPDAAWDLDGATSPGFLSPEMSLLSPMLQRGLHAVAYDATMRSEVAVVVSPEVCKVGGGVAGGSSVCDANVNRDIVCSHVMLADCAAQQVQTQVDGSDVRGGNGAGGALCSADTVREAGRGGTGRPWPPVARHLDLTFAVSPQNGTQQQQAAHVSDPFSSFQLPGNAQPDENQDRNDSNRCGSGIQQQSSVDEEHQIVMPPDAAGNALQELLDEVDAAVASGRIQSTLASPPRSSCELGAADESDTGPVKVQQVAVRRAESSAEQPITNEQSSGAEASNAAPAVQQAENQITELGSVQNNDTSLENGAEGAAVHEAVSLGRGGVGDTSVNDTTNPADVEATAAAATDAGCTAISPASFDDIDDDDLYRLFAATCTGSLSQFNHPSLPTFTDVLLNDDADLDWMEAEAPDLDIEMHDINDMHYDAPDDFPEDACSLPPGDEILEAPEHLGDGAECAGACDGPGGGAVDEDSGQENIEQIRKRTREGEDASEDEAANTENEGAPKMSRFERYEKRCQLRENLPELLEDDEPLRPFTRSCREDLYPIPAAEKHVDNSTAQQSSDVAGGESSAAGAEWPVAAVSSTTGVGCAMTASYAELAAPAGPESSTATPSVPQVNEQVVSAGQLRQLYAQVQVHTQLLLQTLALASPGVVAPAVMEDVVKLWGWPADTPSVEQQTETEQTAGECWRMLTEWAQLSTELSSHRPQKRVTASQVGALALSAKEALEDSEAAAETLCDSLQEGWRPILVGGVAPCIAHVPWLDHIDSLAAAFGTSQPVSDTCGTEVATLDTRTNQECSAAENVAPATPQVRTRTCTALEPDKDTQSVETSSPPKRGPRKSLESQSKFLVPINDDPDDLRRVNQAKRLSRTSPFAAHVHAEFARFAVFWNRAFFPRIVQASLASNDNRRKQISLCEQRLMAVCVMQHGRNYEMLASLMPGWTPEHVKARLHNYKRLMKADTKETGGAELRIALADIVNRVIDIVDGPLSKEEFDLISQAMWDPTTIVLGDEDDKAKFEKIAKNVVRWRTPKQINMHWTATARAVLPVLKGTPRPVQELRQLLSKSLLNGAHPSLFIEDFPNNDASGKTCSVPFALHNQPSTVSDEQQGTSVADVAPRAARAIGASQKGKKKQKVLETSENGSGVSLQEEWPKTYRADILKHAEQLYDALRTLSQPGS